MPCPPVRRPGAHGTLGQETIGEHTANKIIPQRSAKPWRRIFHFSPSHPTCAPKTAVGVGRMRSPVRSGDVVDMDETATPLTWIASAPDRYPWQAHARGLIAHVVLGIATDILLRATERIR